MGSDKKKLNLKPLPAFNPTKTLTCTAAYSASESTPARPAAASAAAAAVAAHPSV